MILHWLTWERLLQRAALAAVVVALCFALIAMWKLTNDLAAADANIEQVQRAVVRAEMRNRQLTAEVGAKQTAMDRVQADINSELRRSEQLELEMSEMLVRVRELDRLRERYHVLKEGNQARFYELNDTYDTQVDAILEALR